MEGLIPEVPGMVIDLITKGTIGEIAYFGPMGPQKTTEAALRKLGRDTD